MVRFSFSGHDLVALPQGALFWPARRALLVADLHFEKASWFARFGQMLPPYDSLATLADLEALAAATDARELWCLGDSFHDSQGCERLPAKARAKLEA
ncbi:MAG: phosphoesterase, partial [Sphingomonadales bacterium]|nr:phosphoesterase [Sphingomonadales bacterium]